MVRRAVGIISSSSAAVALAAMPALAAGEGKLGAGEIEAAFAGKTLQIRTEKVTTGDPANPSGTVRRGDGGHIVFRVVLRGDRSVIFVCTYFDRHGRPGNCARPGAHTRDVGVWSVEGDRFCYQWLTARSRLKYCHEVLRDGGRLRFRQASGPPALIDGEIVEIK